MAVIYLQDQDRRERALKQGFDNIQSGLMNLYQIKERERALARQQKQDQLQLLSTAATLGAEPQELLTPEGQQTVLRRYKDEKERPLKGLIRPGELPGYLEKTKSKFSEEQPQIADLSKFGVPYKPGAVPGAVQLNPEGKEGFVKGWVYRDDNLDQLGKLAKIKSDISKANKAGEKEKPKKLRPKETRDLLTNPQTALRFAQNLPVIVDKNINLFTGSTWSGLRASKLTPGAFDDVKKLSASLKTAMIDIGEFMNNNRKISDSMMEHLEDMFPNLGGTFRPSDSDNVARYKAVIIYNMIAERWNDSLQDMENNNIDVSKYKKAEILPEPKIQNEIAEKIKGAKYNFLGLVKGEFPTSNQTTQQPNNQVSREQKIKELKAARGMP